MAYDTIKWSGVLPADMAYRRCTVPRPPEGTTTASGRGSNETTMLVNNPHNLRGAKTNGGFDEF
jgi:hypothetical protein